MLKLLMPVNQAVFTGYNSRSLDISSATVGGVKVPRATTKFHYKTKIVSENFKGSSSNSSAEYINAALVQAPIIMAVVINSMMMYGYKKR
ncbi:MAG: hypothetical protein QFX12_02995 [Rickettsia africae]|uniref:hypothetical protein n=1 Tax=Rickettsia africae TaxID=35788 RepID=UPI001F2A84FA|nr:hypothetical protein [Rickettsia africae]